MPCLDLAPHPSLGGHLTIVFPMMSDIAGRCMLELMGGKHVAISEAVKGQHKLVMIKPSNPAGIRQSQQCIPTQGWQPSALASSSDGHRCWLQILELMGGEHAAISEAAKGMHNVEVTGPPSSAEKEDMPPEKQESPSEQKESE